MAFVRARVVLAVLLVAALFAIATFARVGPAWMATRAAMHSLKSSDPQQRRAAIDDVDRLDWRSLAVQSQATELLDALDAAIAKEAYYWPKHGETLPPERFLAHGLSIDSRIGAMALARSGLRPLAYRAYLRTGCAVFLPIQSVELGSDVRSGNHEFSFGWGLRADDKRVPIGEEDLSFNADRFSRFKTFHGCLADLGRDNVETAVYPPVDAYEMFAGGGRDLAAIPGHCYAFRIHSADKSLNVLFKLVSIHNNQAQIQWKVLPTSCLLPRE